MTRVDFYLLSDAASLGRERIACRLAEKAYQLGHRVYIHAESSDLARRLDDLLWTFRAGSFVPHALFPCDASHVPPVLIGHNDAPADSHDVLINLATEVPTFFSRYERVAEVIDQDEQRKRAGRERFRFYRDRGYALETHPLSGQNNDG